MSSYENVNIFQKAQNKKKGKINRKNKKKKKKNKATK